MNVEAGRGLAALLVVLYHVDKYYIGGAGYWPEAAMSQVARFGHAGVQFFFVLSGYIMFTVHGHEFGRAGAVATFARKRFERLYPLFWCVLLVTVVLFAIFPTMGSARHRDTLLILENALLVGREPLHAVVFVSWSLFHEVLFYAVFAFMLWRPRLGAVAFAAWIIVCSADALLPDGPWPQYWTAYINVLFAIGLASAAALKRFTIPAPRLVLLAGAVAFLGLGLFCNQSPQPAWVEDLGFGVASALALLGAVEAERQGLLRAPAWLVTLGGASYAVYLTHMLTLPLLCKVAATIGLTHVLAPEVAFLGLTVCAVAVGVVVHQLVDAPILQMTRKLLAPRPAAS